LPLFRRRQKNSPVGFRGLRLYMELAQTVFGFIPAPEWKRTSARVDTMPCADMAEF
jgi:hypothetical protein